MQRTGIFEEYFRGDGNTSAFYVQVKDGECIKKPNLGTYNNEYGIHCLR